MNINIDLSEKNLIYILNCLNLCMRCLEYHYEIHDIREETKRYFNKNNYAEDYDNIKFLHRVLSTKGNKEIYNISNNVFFKGQADYLCTKEKDFKILKIKSRYKNVKNKEKNLSFSKIINFRNNKFFYKFNRYKYY